MFEKIFLFDLKMYKENCQMNEITFKNTIFYNKGEYILKTRKQNIIYNHFFCLLKILYIYILLGEEFKLTYMTLHY